MQNDDSKANQSKQKADALVNALREIEDKVRFHSSDYALEVSQLCVAALAAYEAGVPEEPVQRLALSPIGELDRADFSAWRHWFEGQLPAPMSEILRESIIQQGQCPHCTNGVIRSLGRDNDEVIEDCPKCSKALPATGEQPVADWALERSSEGRARESGRRARQKTAEENYFKMSTTGFEDEKHIAHLDALIEKNEQALKKAQAKIFAVEKVMGWLCEGEVYDRLHAAIFSDQWTELSTHDEQRAEIEALRAKVAELDETLKHARAELRTSVSSEVIGARLRDYSFQRCRAELAEQERDEWKAKAEKLSAALEMAHLFHDAFLEWRFTDQRLSKQDKWDALLAFSYAYQESQEKAALAEPKPADQGAT